MKILILNGSPRANGNTSALTKAFAEGAQSAGHEITTFHVGSMKINGCLGCEYCHGKGEGKCIQNDDMQQLYPAMKEADLVVLASSVYYWSFSGQLQSVITRFYAPGKPAAGKYAMILSSGSPNVYDAIFAQYNSMLNYFGAESVGIKTFNGGDQTCEANLKEMFDFGASL